MCGSREQKERHYVAKCRERSGDVCHSGREFERGKAGKKGEMNTALWPFGSTLNYAVVFAYK